jgi:hypothetical protein
MHCGKKVLKKGVSCLAVSLFFLFQKKFKIQNSGPVAFSFFVPSSSKLASLSYFVRGDIL